MKLVNRTIDVCILALAGVGGIALGFLLVAICYSTFSRFVFNRPISSLVEYSAYCLLLIAFLAAPWLLQLKRHVGVDLVPNALSPLAKTILQASTNVLGCLLCSVVCYYSSLLTISNYQKGILIMDTMGTPQWILISAIPIGMFFLAIQFLRNLIEDFKALTQKKKGGN